MVVSASKMACNKRAIEKKREFVREQKSRPCTDCGVQYPYYVMHFDHLGDKAFSIRDGRSGSYEKLKQEMAKCEVVCANCHAERTFQRAQGSGRRGPWS